MWVRIPPPAPDLIRVELKAHIAASAGGVRAPKRRVFGMRGQMSKRARKWIGRAVIGVLVGLALGFAIGWWLWPVQYTNTAPDVLRQDYRDDYVVMIATAYEVDGDLEQAREWLTLLDPDEPAAPVVELAQRLVEVGGGAEDIARLVRLAWAVGTLPPELTPYLEDQPQQ